MLHIPDAVWRKIAKKTRGTHWALWTYLITPAAILSIVGVTVIFIGGLDTHNSSAYFSSPSRSLPCVLSQLPALTDCPAAPILGTLSLAEVPAALHESAVIAVSCSGLVGIVVDYQDRASSIVLRDCEHSLVAISFSAVCELYSLRIC